MHYFVSFAFASTLQHSTVAESKLKDHLKRCNSRPRPQSYYVENINLHPPSLSPSLSGQSTSSNSAPRKTLQSLPPSELQALIRKVENIYDDMIRDIGGIRTVVLSHACMKDKLELKKYQKHLLQQASLIGHMDRLGLLENGSCFIEFGAGKGELCSYVKTAVDIKLQSSQNNENQTLTSHYVLVDKRKNFRCKFDRYLKTPTLNSSHSTDGIDSSTAPASLPANSTVERIQIDMTHFHLPLVPSISSFSSSSSLDMKDSAERQTPKPVVAIGKHLCGGATDIGLRCLYNYISHAPVQSSMSSPVCTNSSSERQNKVKGLTIALCCHQLCSYESYIARDFLEKYDIGKEAFELIKGLSSWAVCGVRPSKTSQSLEGASDGINQADRIDRETEHDHDQHHQSDSLSTSTNPDTLSTFNELHLTHAQRELIGYKTKRSLDYGRLTWLRSQGFNTELVYYVENDVSLENCAILAWV
ncbi:methyltransferase TRM13-domain-containing protein [Paraphysoderma sedebokerense]|nr:methyltransferase TRM13-domain-containing protein [Paraphysoderma sedebokerense]